MERATNSQATGATDVAGWPQQYLTCLRSDYPRNASSEAESWDNEYIPYTPGVMLPTY